MKYTDLAKHYESCFEKWGDTPQGVDWPNAEDAFKRYQVMLDLIPAGGDQSKVLDFGCGTSGLLDYILRNEIRGIEYSGMDLSQRFVDYSRKKFPKTSYYCLDILKDDLPPGVSFHYALCNGVFTEKHAMSFEEMFNFTQRVLSRVFELCSKGLAFNVMSKNVDWERPDLFHVPLDCLTKFLTSQLSRHFTVREDYGLYEFTVYLYKEVS